MDELIRVEDFAGYDSAVPAEVKAALKDIGPEDIPVLFEAFHNNASAGIVIAVIEKTLKMAEILFVYVRPEHRNQHLSRQLVAKVEAAARKEGAHMCTCVYPLADPFTEAVEHTLKALSWKGKRPFLIRCFFDPFTFNPPWLRFDARYPPGYEEFLWKDLTSDDRAELSAKKWQRRFSPSVSPFRGEENIELLNSLGLRFQGKVVGWMITHRVDPETIRYSSLYVERSLQMTGIAMKLLAHAIERHVRAPTKRAMIEIPLLEVDSSWIRLIEKRLVPYATETARLQQAWKSLS